jgi:hypothetical protein
MPQTSKFTPYCKYLSAKYFVQIQLECNFQNSPTSASYTDCVIRYSQVTLFNTFSLPVLSLVTPSYSQKSVTLENLRIVSNPIPHSLANLSINILNGPDTNELAQYQQVISNFVHSDLVISSSIQSVIYLFVALSAKFIIKIRIIPIQWT